MTHTHDAVLVRRLSDLRRADIAAVGGKNASLGEMIGRLAGAGIRVPGGFATTAAAYWRFLAANRLTEGIAAKLGELAEDAHNLAAVGKAVRGMILAAGFPPELSEAISRGYREMGRRAVAVRSSATAEDLPEASFAGQLESFLNVRGERALLDACKRCYASLFTDRAIVYRRNHGFDHMKIALSVGVQEMVRAEKAGAGVMFSIDTETGFDRVALINAAWGLGENVVQGQVDPDEYMVFKPLLADPLTTPIVEKRCGGKERRLIYDSGGERATVNVPCTPEERAAFVLSDAEILSLARWACAIEAHYGMPMDMEWAKDGATGELFIVQARPETVVSRRETGVIKRTALGKTGPVLAEGMAVGELIGAGKAVVIRSAEQIQQFKAGMVLVTEMTDPDWVPIMKIASAIVTDSGGRTCHAAIISRELGIPCIVGTGNGSSAVKTGQEITVSCAGGSKGLVYEGKLPYKQEEIRLDQLETRYQSLLNDHMELLAERKRLEERLQALHRR